ncbi:MAG TPA: glycosyltransferase family 9 protein, partial [Acidobacteriota bacterium]
DSVHEWGAQFAYQKKFFVPKDMHSLSRMRELLASAIGYSIQQTDPDYGIDRSRLNSASAFRKPYLVFVHCTSWLSKNWDEDYWRRLLAQSAAEGFSILLPWGNESERKRAERIAGDGDRAIVLPAMTIGEKASVLANADAVVGCDTGLSHIAAALDVPAITLYGPTDPALIGASGKNQAHLASDFECVRCHQSRCTYPNQPHHRPACLASITPDRVLAELRKLLRHPANV